jgi:hypothetical protein
VKVVYQYQDHPEFIEQLIENVSGRVMSYTFAVMYGCARAKSAGCICPITKRAVTMIGSTL